MYHRKINLDTEYDQKQAQAIIKEMGRLIRHAAHPSFARHQLGLCIAFGQARRTVLGPFKTEPMAHPAAAAVDKAFRAYQPNTKYAREHAYWYPRTAAGTRRRLKVIARLAKQFA